MNGSEIRDSFEKQWQEALEGAELSPSGRVWEQIDRDLANADASRYKRKAIIYKYAAVVAILVAVSVSIPSNWIRKGASDQFVAQKENQPTLVSIPSLPNANGSDDAGANGISYNHIISFPAEKDEEKSADKRVDLYTDQHTYELFTSISRKGSQGLDVDLDQFWIDPVPDYSFSSVVSQRNKYNRFWAGVGLGSSSFDPNYQSNTTDEVTSAVLTSRPHLVKDTKGGGSISSVSEEISEGVNFQLGLNMGMRIANRWTLESGMQYGEAMLTTTTNIVVENRHFARSVPLSSEASNLESINRTQEIVEYVEDDVVLNNTFHFASVPVKAGFIILDKRVNLRINAGVITNFYLGNTLKDPTKSLATIELSPGDNSPYRTVSFSGHAGLSVGYRLLKNLDLMVEPNYAQSIHPFIGTSSNFAATPSGLGLSAGVRYNFK